MNEVYHVMTIQEMEQRMDKQNDIINKQSDIINEHTNIINQLIDDITITKAMLKLVLAIGPKDRSNDACD